MKTNVWNQDYEITCKKLCLLQVFYFEVCFLAISNQLYYLRLSKVWSMLHYGSVGRVQNQNNECHYIFINIIFWHFFVLLLAAKLVFTIFNSFYEVSNFGNRILTSQKYEFMIRNCQWSCTFVSFNLNKYLDFETMALSFI